MSSATELIRETDAESLRKRVATELTATLQSTLANEGIAHLVLTGGTIGVALLADVDPQLALDWERIHIWWGDERWVERSSSERNANQAREVFLERVTLPRRNIHEIPASDDGYTLSEATERYRSELAREGWSNSATAGVLPPFSVLLLGVGPDSHVASLFPGHVAAENVNETATYVLNSPKPPAERITLTFPSIDSAARVWIVASGTDKAEAVRNALLLNDPVTAPVSAVQGRLETKIFADENAASLIPA